MEPNLTNDQIYRLQRALDDSFRSEDAFRAFLQALGSPYQGMVMREDVASTALSVITLAQARNEIKLLLRVARSERPYSNSLDRFAFELQRASAAIGPAARLIGSEQYQHLIATLMACPELGGNRSLVDLLRDLDATVSETEEASQHLPPLDLAKRLVDHLLPTFLPDGTPALEAVLTSLQRHQSDSGRKAALDQAAADLAYAFLRLNNVSPIETANFVVAAMTRTTAEALFNGPAGDPDSAILRAAIQPEELDELLDGYGDSPDDWRPAVHRPAQIRDVMTRMVNQLNLLFFNREDPPRLLRPSFWSDRFFGQLQLPLYPALGDLTSKRIVIVLVDALSLFSSDFVQRLTNTGLANQYQGTAVVVFFPVPLSAVEMNRQAEQRARTRLELTFGRSERELDLRCEIGVVHQMTLPRWMMSVLPELLGRSDRPIARSPEIEQRPASGVERVLF